MLYLMTMARNGQLDFFQNTHLKWIRLLIISIHLTGRRTSPSQNREQGQECACVSQSVTTLAGAGRQMISFKNPLRHSTLPQPTFFYWVSNVRDSLTSQFSSAETSDDGTWLRSKTRRDLHDLHRFPHPREMMQSHVNGRSIAEF